MAPHSARHSARQKERAQVLRAGAYAAGGVAIGLSLVATRVVPDHGAQIRAIILCGTLIYELFGPVVTKISLTKAGEIVPAANEKK